VRTVLWVALAGPLLGAVAAWWAPDGESGRWLARAVALGTAALWLVVAFGGDVDGGPVVASGATAPIGAGAALLFAATTRPADRRSALLGSLVVAAVAAGPALADGDGGAPELAVTLAVAGALPLVASWRGDDAGRPAALLGAAGAVVGVATLAEIVAGTSALEVPPGPYDLVDGLGLVLAGALLAAAALLQPRRLTAPLLAAGLALAVEPAAQLDRGATALAVAAAVGAVVLLARWPDPRARPAAIALAALAAAAAVPDGRPAALLLAAAAVLAAVVLHPLAAVAALPGAAALVAAVVDDPTPARTAVALAVAAAGVLLAQRPGARTDGAPPLAAVAPALAVAAWLVLGPTTWGWVGDASLHTWAAGAGVATATVAAALVLGWGAGWLPLPAAADLGGADPAGPAPARRLRTVEALVPLSLLGISLLALVASVLRASSS
jgi:hypothetical protein